MKSMYWFEMIGPDGASYFVGGELYVPYWAQAVFFTAFVLFWALLAYCIVRKIG